MNECFERGWEKTPEDSECYEVFTDRRLYFQQKGRGHFMTQAQLVSSGKLSFRREIVRNLRKQMHSMIF